MFGVATGIMMQPKVSANMDDPRPVVSVITPVRNGQSALAACLASVRRQAFSGWEHILIDDGSDDDTRVLLQRFAAEDRRIRLLLNDHPQGAAKARNLGMSIARGRFIAFLDADDLWLPGKLTQQTAFMLRNDIAFSYGSYRVQQPTEGRSGPAFCPPASLSYSMLLGGCPIGCLTVMYDRTKLGTRFFPEFKRGQDWALWLQLAREGTSMRRYPGLHAVYRQAGLSLSSNKFAKLQDVWRIYRAQEKQPILHSALWLFRHFMHVAAKRRYLTAVRLEAAGRSNNSLEMAANALMPEAGLKTNPSLARFKSILFSATRHRGKP